MDFELECAVAKGILLVMMDPPPSLEQEFNAWYDQEHLPERLGVEGFESARRYLCLQGSPKYLALYDLTKLDVLQSPAYERVSGKNDSAWTRAVLKSVRVQRNVGVQRHPGDALTSNAPRLLLMRFRGAEPADEEELLAGLDANFARRPLVANCRLFSCEAPDGNAYYALVETRLPLDATAIDAASFGKGLAKLDMLNLYARYTNP
jgi:hypothetical protein